MAVHIESHLLFLCSFAFHNQTIQTDFHASVKQDKLVPLCFPSRTIYFEEFLLKLDLPSGNLRSGARTLG